MNDHRHDLAAGQRLLRTLKAILALSVGAWAILGLLANLTGWVEARSSVVAVASMSTFAAGGASWRATTSPLVIEAGVAFIVIFKLVSASLSLAGAWRMLAARGAGADGFRDAKTLALAGCVVAVLGLFVGWTVIAEGWFQLWKSDALRDVAAETAFRYGGMIGLIGLLIAMPDE